jgi:hypothetical protein
MHVEMGRTFPNRVTVAPSSDIRDKFTVDVENMDQVKVLQKERYEILSWER